MSLIGFSTGALAYSDYERGLSLVRRAGLPAVELSALRESELEPLMSALGALELEGIEYASVHAPSKLQERTERETVELLKEAAHRRFPVIVHPDVINDVDCWSELGDMLCIENNDRRKRVGQRHADLAKLFQLFPDAGFCLDLGHAKQVDSTMTEAYFMLKDFGNRLRQLHVSEVTARSRHVRLSSFTIHSFRVVAGLINPRIPAIIESIVENPDEIPLEVRAVQSALQPRAVKDRTESSKGSVDTSVEELHGW
jgi:sugar phosphate isomerase/epimerase